MLAIFTHKIITK